MKYVKSCLIITMLLGVGYSGCIDYPEDIENDCGVGQYCGACCDSEAGDIVLCSGSGPSACDVASGTWNGVEECETTPDYCDPEQYNCDCNEDTWQEYYPDMAGCYLSGADLSWVILAHANLFDADLSDADLSDASLYMADLAAANLSGANLYGAHLTGACFSYADLSFADLSDTDCNGAFFVGANLEGTNFEDAYLTYAYFDETGDCSSTPPWIPCDGYDDVSYDAGAESGDLNLDGIDNVLDVVILVNNILNP